MGLVTLTGNASPGRGRGPAPARVGLVHPGASPAARDAAAAPTVSKYTSSRVLPATRSVRVAPQAGRTWPTAGDGGCRQRPRGLDPVAPGCGLALTTVPVPDHRGQRLRCRAPGAPQKVMTGAVRRRAALGTGGQGRAACASARPGPRTGSRCGPPSVRPGPTRAWEDHAHAPSPFMSAHHTARTAMRPSGSTPAVGFVEKATSGRPDQNQREGEPLLLAARGDARAWRRRRAGRRGRAGRRSWPPASG